MKRFKFNSECDKVIAQFISQNELLKEAFDECATVLETTPKSIEGRYYRNKEVIDNMIVNIINGKSNCLYRFVKNSIIVYLFG